jgi:hypothetical protein
MIFDRDCRAVEDPDRARRLVSVDFPRERLGI